MEKTERGTVIKGVGGLYTVALDDGTTALCPARGKFRHEGETPYPGDRVTVERDGDAFAVGSIEARRNVLIRPAVANLTYLVAVIPAAQPKADLITADKLIATAEEADIIPVIAVNKADLDPAQAERIAGIYRRVGYDVFPLCAADGEGVDALYGYLTARAGEGKPLVVFSGASGAGKSTLMTRMFPELKLKTGAVSRKSERGRHTTRTAELFDVGGIYLADTPGFTMLDFAKFNFFPTENLAFSFREFLPYIGKCRYTKCTHTKEEGCAILAAVGEGAIPAERHGSYVQIRAEMAKTPEWKRRKMDNR